jgi:hypothetical protein
MTIEEQLKKRLGVPENWDKHDYKHGRYSFNDLLEIAEELVKSNSVLDGVMQSCDTCKHLSTCRFWQEAPNNGATCKFYIEHVA